METLVPSGIFPTLTSDYNIQFLNLNPSQKIGNNIYSDN